MTAHFDYSRPKDRPLRLAVFVGSRGRGSNLRAIAQAIQERRLAASVVLVVGGHRDAPAIGWAKENQLRTTIISARRFNTEHEYAEALLRVLGDNQAEAIALAGYMRRLPSAVVGAFRNRILNTHPALLPAFGGQGMYGAQVHQAVLAYGAKVSGCTIHLVDEEYDTGPIVAQRAVPVADDDTIETLAARILPHEHAAYIEALQLLAEDRLQVIGRCVHILPL